MMHYERDSTIQAFSRSFCAATARLLLPLLWILHSTTSDMIVVCNKSAIFGQFWTQKRVPMHASAIPMLIVLSLLLLLSDFALRLCRFSTDRNETFHTWTTTFCIKLPWRIFYRAMHFNAERGLAIACLSVCRSVRPSVCDVGGLWSHRLEILETNCVDN